MSADRPSVLELRDVHKRFGGTPAIAGLSLSILPGEVFTLLGPSGCGKSTTLRIVAGLEEPDSGDVYLEERLMASGERRFSLPPERRNLGMVFQSYAIWPHMTVFENIAFPLQLRGASKSEIHNKVERVLQLVGLDGFGGRPATDLSGGQQQRVALARAIVYEPKLLLLDEPLSNLDAKLREYMRIELRALQRRLGIAVLFVTHDKAEAMALSDRIAVMQSGRLEQIGTPIALYEHPASPFVRDFLGRVLTVEVSLASAEHAEVPGEAGVILQLPPGCAPPARATDKLLLAWRPEDVSIEPDSAPGLNRLSATIESAAYLGERIEYGVRTAGGKSFLVASSRRERYEPGARVGLQVDTSEATMWIGE
jgi:ABC-type Fe3+/spermidine/putrescine transport system ATPase subunit